MNYQVYSELFPKLPPPYTITNTQIRSYYRSLYTKLLGYYNSNDFTKINKLLDYSSIKNVIPYLKLQCSEDESSDDTLLADLAYLLYKIITIYPIKYFKTQFLAVKFLEFLLFNNEIIKGLTVDWHPLYKVFTYYLYQKDFFMTEKMKVNVISTMVNLISQLSFYFLDEIDENIDGVSVKTNTTKQIVKKLLTFRTLQNIDLFLPYYKSRYTLYLDYLLNFMIKNSDYNFTILPILVCTIQSNIEDDFSSLIPILKEVLRTNIINLDSSQPKEFSCKLIGNFVSSLFISPPTRQKIIEIFENFFPKFKFLCHPSQSNSDLIRTFIKEVVFSLNDDLIALNKKTERKKFFNAEKDIYPSKEELHKLLTMTSEINIINVADLDEEGHVMTEIKLDPLLIDRYFEIGFQCINLVEALNVAKAGWLILLDLIDTIEENETFRNNFETLFLMATRNLHHFDQQSAISQFIMICLFKVPFNKETTVKGLEYVNFPELAVSYFTNLISILKSLPLVNQEIAQIDRLFFNKMKYSVTTLFRNCDDSVFAELLPIFCSFASDESLSSCVYQIGFIVSKYCNYAKSEQSQKIVRSFKRQLDIKTFNNLNILRYLLNIYSAAFICSSKTIETIKQTVDFLLQYTKNENEKIRKIAWSAFSYSTLFVEIWDITISLKKDAIKNNAFDYAELKDFDMKHGSILDTSDLIFESVNPVFDQIMTLKDPTEIYKILNECIDNISDIIGLFTPNSEGSMDSNNINDSIIGSINIVSDFIRKSFPLKDNFFKCANRIIKDFPENENLITNILKNINIYSFKYEKNFVLFKNFISESYSDIKYNSALLYYLFLWTVDKRKEYLLPPLNDEYKQLIINVTDLMFSKSKKIQESCIIFLQNAAKYYSPFIYPIIENKILNQLDSIPYPQLIHFISYSPEESILLSNDRLLCEILIYLLKNFELNDQETWIHLKGIITFLSLFTLPNETKICNKAEYVDLLEKIENSYLYKYQNNRSYNLILMQIIYICLREVNEISDAILEFAIKNITHFDDNISVIAYQCFSSIMERRKKFTKEKKRINEYPSYFPNILEQVSIDFNKNDIYIPKLINDDEIEPTNSIDIENCYSLDSEPSNSLDVNIQNTETNKEIMMVFHSFKKIKIEWINDEFLESKYFSNFEVNSTKMYKETFTIKNYEFTENKLLIKSIKNFFAGSMISLNEKNAKNGIPYSFIWELYAKTVGSYCLHKLNRLCIKYLSQYFKENSLFTSSILFDMIVGFMNAICFWNPRDRIDFFKLVALPVIFIISSNPKTADFVYRLFDILCKTNSPYCFAPIFKALYIFAPSGPNLPVFNRMLTSTLIQQISIKPLFYFTLIDQLNEKFVQPFIERFDEYKSNEVEQMIQLIFAIHCSVYESKVFLPSDETEPKQDLVFKIFDEILEKQINNNDNTKRNLIRSLIYSFNKFTDLAINTQSLIVSIFNKHFHKIINLMNYSNLKEEEEFFNGLNAYIRNIFFFYNTDLEFQLISSLINEMMNSSLKIQLFLADCINSNLEDNIFTIPKDDYPKYEDILLKYNHHVMEKNPSTKLRLNIAKILGIFEVRNCTFNPDFNDVENNVLKAGSILLNSYLFDRVDDNVTKAFDFMEKCCTTSDSKNIEFYENISEIFIHIHSNHVINEAEALIYQYNRIPIPSYFC